MAAKPRHQPIRSTASRWFALASSSLLLAACTPEAKPKVEAAQPVRVMTVSFQKRDTNRTYTGVVKSRVESDLGFRVGGKITQRLVDVGNRVALGEVIARLDATDYQLSLESQQAELRAATSSRDQAVAAEGRYRDLLAKGHVSTAALEQRVAAADEARQRVEKAVRAIATAKNQVAYTELAANAAGVISLLPVEVGQVVTAGQTVARLAKSGELEVQVAVPEQQLDDLKAATATVTLWSKEAVKYAARLREVAPDADASSRTYQARYTLEAPGADIALGMTATVSLSLGREATVARLPLPAVMNDGRGASVFVLDDTGTRITQTPVEVLAFGRDDVAVSSGITDGQRIVTLGTQLLDASRPVRIVEGAADATRAALLIK